MPSSKSSLIRVLTIAVGLIAVLVAARLLPVTEWLNTLNTWVTEAGTLGLIVFITIYILACVFMLPGSILTLGAGFAFGLGWGMAAVSAGSTLGAGAAFLVARYFARGWVKDRFASDAKFAAIDSAVSQQGWKIVALLRLSPIFPFNALNYLLGLTGIRFWDYLAASWIGMIPGTLLYVYIGYAGRTGIESAAGGDTNLLRFVYLGLGLIATIFVTVFVTRIARRALAQATEVDQEAAGSRPAA